MSEPWWFWLVVLVVCVVSIAFTVANVAAIIRTRRRKEVPHD